MLEDLCQPALSIRLNPSEDGESSELPGLPTEKESLRLKCFRCFGRADPQCPECLGTESVPGTHPLAFLLGQVLNRKLQLPTGRRVCPIKEEEEEAEGGKGGCVVYTGGCGQKEGGQSSTGEDSSCWEGPVDLSGCTFLRQEDKRCHHCSCSIENCYTVCKTCLAEGVSYWICDACSDSHCFTHPASHLLEPVIDYDELKDKIETISQDYDEESNENDFPEEQPSLDKKNSSIANYLEEDYDFMNRNSGEVREASRVKFEIEGLFSSYDFKSIQKLTKGQGDRKSNCSSKGKGKSQAMKENLVQQKTPTRGLSPSPPVSSYAPSPSPQRHPHYAFVDYKCDFCEMQPILNVRYHCRVCQDYDLCEKCYQDCDSIHEHQTFDCIDARLIREKAMQRLFQLRDTNLRTTNQPQKECIKSTFFPRLPAKAKPTHFNTEHLAH